MSGNRTVIAVAFSLLAVLPSPSSAQPLGTFRWQLQPYCNVLSLSVTQQGGLYTLDGTDDQCSATGPRASVNGIAFMNPSGQIGFGLTIVTTPGGTAVHVDATINISTLSGTWRDSAGQTGTFQFTPGPSSGGSPRPAAVIGAAAVNASQVQLRVTGTCAGGQTMTAVNQDGTVACITPPAGAGDITDVIAGTGLSGGASVGAAMLSVNFGGTGAAATVARSDHNHSVNSNNIRIGELALASLTTGTDNSALGTGALFSVTDGTSNTAVGFQSANSISNGSRNVAVGRRALHVDQTGVANTAVGHEALCAHNGGNGNTAVGDSALINVPTGSFNSALGYGALAQLTNGQNNLALGMNGGNSLITGSNDVYVANPGLASENNTIRIGTGGSHTRLFLAATRGVTTANNDAVSVVIDSSGQIGTISSSRETKEEIENLGDVGRRVQQLRPVQFRYRQAFADGSKPIQYGLIAEEVEEVLPELVARNEDGQPETVKYHVLPTLLLAEVQRLERERVSAMTKIDDQSRELAELKALVVTLQRQLADVHGQK
jgi:endosialidase-like protein